MTIDWTKEFADRLDLYSKVHQAAQLLKQEHQKNSNEDQKMNEIRKSTLN